MNGERVEESAPIILEENFSGLALVNNYMILYEVTYAPEDSTSLYKILDFDGNIIREGEISGRFLTYYGYDENTIIFS